MHLGWLVDGDRMVAVRIDEPGASSQHGVVVIVPAVSRETVVSFRTIRALAVAAAEAGFRTLSMSFSGDGESSSLEDVSDVAARWSRDLQFVVEIARDLANGSPVHLVGLRIGGTLINDVPLREGETATSWEPVGGREFLRRHRTIRKLAVRGPLLDEGVELDGGYYTTEQAASVSAIRAPTVGYLNDARRIRRESDREVAKRIALVSPHFAEIPHAGISELVASLPRMRDAPVPKTMLSDRVAESFAGPGFEETQVRVGPHALAGVLARPVGPPTRAAVVFTAIGVELKCGPGNLWTLAARDLARSGVASLRVDRRLIGDSVDTRQSREPRPYTEAAVEDVVDASQYLSDATGVPVWIVGSCSGAWLALKAAGLTPIERILAINPVHWNPDPRAYDEAFYAREFAYESEFADLVSAAEDDAPEAWWRETYRRARRQLGIRFPAIRALVLFERREERVGWLLNQADSRTEVRLLCGIPEYGRLRFLGGEHDVRRARARGMSVTLQVSEALDHSLLSEAARREVMSVLRTWTRSG